MGRRRLNVELIKNKKVRYNIYIKRKNCLKKKIDELSTLCGIKVGMLVHGPKENCDSTELDIWPEDPQPIRDLIVSYKRQASEFRHTRTSDVSHYFQNHKKKAQDALVKLRKQNAKYPTWDNCYNNLSEEQLMEFDGFLSRRLEALMNRKYELMKGGQGLASSVSMANTCGQSNLNHSYSFQSLLNRSNMQPEVPHGQPMSPLGMAFDVNFPIHCTFDQGYPELLLNPSSVTNPMMRMRMMSCNNCNQFDSAFSSKMMCPSYFDPMFSMPENIILNSSMPLFNHYYPNMPPMLPDMPSLMMSGEASSQMYGSHMDECNEAGDFKLKHHQG